MVCHGPDPPDNNPQELTQPPRHELLMNANHGDDSDEDQNEYFGYEPLPQGPEAVLSDNENSDDEAEDSGNQPGTANDIPNIESMESVLSREVWNSPRPSDPFKLDPEKAQQVMSAMANFALPPTSIPEWAQSISEDQWKKTLDDKIKKLNITNYWCQQNIKKKSFQNTLTSTSPKVLNFNT